MHNEHHHFELHKILHDRMGKLYAYQAFLMFVKSLIGIFVPVYLFKLGFSIIEILIYLFGTSLTYLLMIPLTMRLINFLGYKKTIIFSTPIYFLHILSLNFILTNDFIFHLSWFSFGLYVSIFWPAMHCEIAINGSNKHRGSQMGTLQIITMIFSTMAPFIGGFVLETQGYYNLLVFASVIIFIGSFPLFLLKDIKLKKFNFRYKDYLRLIKDDKYFYSKKAFMCEGIEWLLAAGIWPIILFLLLNQNFANLGALFTGVSIISALFILYFKSYIDKKSKKQILKIISKLLSLNWFLRGIVFAIGSFFIYIVESFGKIIMNVFHLSFISIFYNNAKKNNYMEYIILRELYLHGAKMGFIILLIIFFSFYEPTVKSLSFIVVAGILASLGVTYMKEDKL